MRFVRSDFKGTQVWAEVNAEGRPSVVGGRRAIRYSDAPGAKIYRATAAGMRDLGGPVIEVDSAPEAAPTAPGAPVAPGAPSSPGASPKAGRGSGFGKAGTRTAAQGAAAATDARGRIAALPAGTVLAFTDGACMGNPGPAGSGAVIKLPDGRVLERYRALGQATNNIGELTAILLAIEVLDEASIPTSTPVALFTDSSYAIGVLCKGWKAKANIELIARIKRALAKWSELELNWVAGHVGIAENERADVLAGRGVAESRR